MGGTDQKGEESPSRLTRAKTLRHGGLKIRTGVAHASASRKSRRSKVAARAKSKSRCLVSQRVCVSRSMADVGMKPTHLFGNKRCLKAVTREPPALSTRAGDAHWNVTPLTFFYRHADGLGWCEGSITVRLLERSSAKDAWSR